MLELLSLFQAPLLVNVLSEIFKLWIKRRSKQHLTLLEGSKKAHRWHGGAFLVTYARSIIFPLCFHSNTPPLIFQAFVLIFIRVCLWFEAASLKLAHALPASILQQRNQLFSREFPPSFLSFVLKQTYKLKVRNTYEIG